MKLLLQREESVGSEQSGVEITVLSSSSEPSKKSDTSSIRSLTKDDSDAETEKTVMSTGAGRTSDIEEEIEATSDAAALHTPPAVAPSQLQDLSPLAELPDSPLEVENPPNPHIESTDSTPSQDLSPVAELPDTPLNVVNLPNPHMQSQEVLRQVPVLATTRAAEEVGACLNSRLAGDSSALNV